jgi:hypothetical protein
MYLLEMLVLTLVVIVLAPYALGVLLTALAGCKYPDRPAGYYAPHAVEARKARRDRVVGWIVCGLAAASVVVLLGNIARSLYGLIG